MQKQPIGVIYMNANFGSGPRFYLLFVFQVSAGKTYKVDSTTDGINYSNPYTVQGTGGFFTITVDQVAGPYPRVIEQA